MKTGVTSAFSGPWIDPVWFDLPLGAGKAGPTKAGPLAGGSALRKAVLGTATVHRRDVVAAEVRRHVLAFGANRPTEVTERLRNRIIMVTAGYDDDPRELYEIEEVRSYWRKVQKECPTILFYSSAAHPPTLQAIFACVSPHVVITRRKDCGMIRVRVEGDTLKPCLATEISSHVRLNMRLGLKLHESLMRLATSLDALFGKRNGGIA